jgi:hypothetical protein
MANLDHSARLGPNISNPFRALSWPNADSRAPIAALFADSRSLKADSFPTAESRP